MVFFKNISYNRFLSEYKDKKIIFFGAGGTLKDILEAKSNNIKCFEKVEFILDNSSTKCGQNIKINKRFIPIMTVEKFLTLNINMDNYVIFLSVSDKGILSVINQLDNIKEFDNVICIYGLGTFLWNDEIFSEPMPVNPIIPQPLSKYNIPKIIHYCWFGSNEMSDLNKACIESWHRYCPDYEVKFWNETNYDLSNTTLYVRQAYDAKKYAFVTDYVRLDVVNKFGGFYFDTDVELFRNLDEFLKYKAVYSFMEYNEIATGLGFASIANTLELYEQMKIYENIKFIDEDGTYNITPCPIYTNKYFENKKVSISNRLQLVDDMLFLPSSYFAPLNPWPCLDGECHLALYCLTPHTYAIHKCDNSWKDANQVQAFNEKKEELKYINERLLKDWKREYILEK